MSKKTTSEQPNEATLLSELKKEYAVYINVLTEKSKLLLFKYPYQLFGTMMLIIILSVGFSSKVLRPSQTVKPHEQKKVFNQSALGFQNLISTGTALNELLQIQNKMKIILQKDTLTVTDSLILEQSLRQLKSINLQKQ